MRDDLERRARAAAAALAAAATARELLEPCDLEQLVEAREQLGTGPLAAALERADLEADRRRQARPDRSSSPTTSRWRCRACSGFVRGANAECSRCRDRGPHVYGEDAPTTGNTARRARLRREQRARQKIRR